MATKTTPKTETKPATDARDPRQKFIELAERRAGEAIRHLRNLGKLTDKTHYTYTDGDWEEIIKSINAEIQTIIDRLKSPTRVVREPLFRLGAGKR